MKQETREDRTISRCTYEAELRHRKEPVLCIRTEVFQFSGRSLPRAARRINAHYRRLARRFKRHGHGALLRRATAARKAAAPGAFTPHTLSLAHKVTFIGDHYLSLYHDHAENDGQARPAVCRTADTWHWPEGAPATLKEICGGARPLRLLLRQAAAEAARLRDAGLAPFFDSCAKAMRRHFDRSRFYLTDKGLALFWEAGVIAPASRGPQEIVVPYGAPGAPRPPETRPAAE